MPGRSRTPRKVKKTNAPASAHIDHVEAGHWLLLKGLLPAKLQELEDQILAAVQLLHGTRMPKPLATFMAGCALAKLQYGQFGKLHDVQRMTARLLERAKSKRPWRDLAIKAKELCPDQMVQDLAGVLPIAGDNHCATIVAGLADAEDGADGPGIWMLAPVLNPFSGDPSGENRNMAVNCRFLTWDVGTLAFVHEVHHRHLFESEIDGKQAGKALAGIRGWYNCFVEGRMNLSGWVSDGMPQAVLDRMDIPGSDPGHGTDRYVSRCTAFARLLCGCDLAKVTAADRTAWSQDWTGSPRIGLHAALWSGFFEGRPLAALLAEAERSSSLITRDMARFIADVLSQKEPCPLAKRVSAIRTAFAN